MFTVWGSLSLGLAGPFFSSVVGSMQSAELTQLNDPNSAAETCFLAGVRVTELVSSGE